MGEFDGRLLSPASVVMLPHFRPLLAATTHMLNFMNMMSLAVIADDLCVKSFVPADNSVMTGSKKVLRKPRKKAPKNGVVRSNIK